MSREHSGMSATTLGRENVSWKGEMNSTEPLNSTEAPLWEPHDEVIVQHAMTSWDDATWILTSAFIIFTMQSGFGLLESGTVTRKNEVNIMVKNVVDVLFGGMSYWAFGYGLSFGDDPRSNPFVGVGRFFLDAQDENMGNVYSDFFFHTSFATTSTTIVSGAMAERTKLESYILFSFFNTFIYCFPAHWLLAPNGWLKTMGVVDIAGAGSVHLIGGLTGLVATIILKPRTGRFDDRKCSPIMGSPTNAIFGMFMLWWGWLGFNCGSTYGITGGKWKLAARSAVSTITASIAGGVVGISLSYVTKRRIFDIGYLTNGVLASLVSITAMCALAHPWQGFLIGGVGALIACLGCELTAKMKIDDPMGVVPVHAMASAWAMLSVGLWIRIDKLENLSKYNGLFYGGGWYMLGIQSLAILTVSAWTLITAFLLLKALDATIGLRVPLHEELLGADLVEHNLNGSYDKTSGELRSLDGKVIHVIRQNGDKTYNANLRRLSQMVSLGMPSRLVSSVVQLDSPADTEQDSVADRQNGNEACGSSGRNTRRVGVIPSDEQGKESDTCCGGQDKFHPYCISNSLNSICTVADVSKTAKETAIPDLV
ncbi:putative ammonium transporter 2 [Ptychodera flava]|uniref:putative ammonium transporter 2 n=1 Tax=Ptychodera flava TaxID=63121 RepID=UPI00396A19B8